MAFQTALIKTDWMWIRFAGNQEIAPLEPFPFRCQSEPEDKNNKNEWELVRDLQPSCWQTPYCIEGDDVYAQWVGGYPESDNGEEVEYQPPMYYESKLISIMGPSSYLVEMSDPKKKNTWITTVDHILGPSYFGTDHSDLFPVANALLIPLGRYIDYSIRPTQRVWCLWQENNGEEAMHSGTVMHVKDINWEVYVSKDEKMWLDDRYQGYTGPFIPVSWDEEDLFTIVPKAHCVLQEEKPALEELQTQVYQAMTMPVTTPEEAVLASLSVANKQLVTAKDITGTQKIHAYWEGKWCKAISSEKRQADILGGHFAFPQVGEFCVVEWESDDEKDDDEDDGDDDDSDSDDDDSVDDDSIGDYSDDEEEQPQGREDDGEWEDLDDFEDNNDDDEDDVDDDEDDGDDELQTHHILPKWCIRPRDDSDS